MGLHLENYLVIDTCRGANSKVACKPYSIGAVDVALNKRFLGYLILYHHQGYMAQHHVTSTCIKAKVQVIYSMFVYKVIKCTCLALVRLAQFGN